MAALTIVMLKSFSSKLLNALSGHYENIRFISDFIADDKNSGGVMRQHFCGLPLYCHREYKIRSFDGKKNMVA